MKLENLIIILNTIQTIAVLAAAVIAICSIRSNTKNAKQRAAIDLILSQMNSKELQDASMSLSSIYKENKGIIVHHYSTNPEYKKRFSKHLNALEFAAMGVRYGILDESVYKNSQRSNILASWSYYKELVYYIREMTGRDVLYQDLEYLAEKWSKD